MFRTPAKQKPTGPEDVDADNSRSVASLSPSPTTSRGKLESQATKKVVTLKFSPPPKKVPQAQPPAGPSKQPAFNKTYTRSTPPKVPRKVANTNNPMHNKRYDRLFEAKEQLEASTEHLNNSRNLKTEIKQSVAYAVKRLYALLCQCDKDLGEALIEIYDIKGKDPGEQSKVVRDMQTQCSIQDPTQAEKTKRKVVKDMQTQCSLQGFTQAEKIEDTAKQKDILLGKLEEHTSLIQKSMEKINNLQQVIEKTNASMSEVSAPKASYASVAAIRIGASSPTYRTLHSVAIANTKENRSGDDTLKDLREALDAKDGGVNVERVRKAKDGRVIVSCRTIEDREKLKLRLKQKKAALVAEDITNKRPLVMITGVLRSHTDDDLFRALRNQNNLIFEGLGEDDNCMEVAYKIRARNPYTQKVILRVTPALWKRFTEEGTVKVDLQTLQVVDRSPLAQCTTCLGFGHSKKQCSVLETMCSHCGGPHTIAECEERAVGTKPACINCTREKRDDVSHNAFSGKCPVRARWDKRIRATVDYC